MPHKRLTHGKSVHPAPPVRCKLHGHAGWGKWVYQRSLGCVAPRPDVQHGFCTANVEPPRGTGVTLLRLQHVLKDI